MTEVWSDATIYINSTTGEIKIIPIDPLVLDPSLRKLPTLIERSGGNAGHEVVGELLGDVTKGKDPTYFIKMAYAKIRRSGFPGPTDPDPAKSPDFGKPQGPSQEE